MQKRRAAKATKKGEGERRKSATLQRRLYSDANSTGASSEKASLTLQGDVCRLTAMKQCGDAVVKGDGNKTTGEICKNDQSRSATREETFLTQAKL